jgi:DNA helicase-2/ATP-dependent DNA helicase PcrA
LSIFTTARDADVQIEECLNPEKLTSFFLFAGAGSGKTRSLVRALQWLRLNARERMWTHGRKVAVITYTNAATDEIKRRIEFDPFIDVSTIHAFAWSLVSGYDADIRLWVKQNLIEDIAGLVAAERTGRAGSKASAERQISIQKKTDRLQGLDKIKTFVYSPAGETRGRGALNHAEVIGLTASLLGTKAALQKVLINRYPVLFVDESQDTNRYLMDALLHVQTTNRDNFCLGLFGDTMQRIFPDGKVNLAGNLPEGWRRPEKLVNYRCPKRVLKLINQIRKQEDGVEQTAPATAIEGTARLFLAKAGSAEKALVEATVVRRMAEATGDATWADNHKTLILEHHMAASRMGFSQLFEPLYSADRLKTGLLEGQLPALRFLTDAVLPLLNAIGNKDSFKVAAVVRQYSSLLDSARLRASESQLELLAKANRGTKALALLLASHSDPSIAQVLKIVDEQGLFELPVALKSVLGDAFVQSSGEGEEEDPLAAKTELAAWSAAVKVPFSQVASYQLYITDRAAFGTHQGVKGLEFPHVMVIIDDEESRGFSFSYEKLFALKPSTAADSKNLASGNETSADRTRRLFYVTCSRSEQSLAIVAYASDPAKLQRYVLEQGWFEANEIELLPN